MGQCLKFCVNRRRFVRGMQQFYYSRDKIWADIGMACQDHFFIHVARETAITLKPINQAFTKFRKAADSRANKTLVQISKFINVTGGGEARRGVVANVVGHWTALMVFTCCDGNVFRMLLLIQAHVRYQVRLKLSFI